MFFMSSKTSGVLVFHSGPASPAATREVELAFLHLIEDFFVGVSVERRISAQNDVEDHSSRPNVAFLVIRPFQDFRGNIKWLNDTRLQFLLLFSWHFSSLSFLFWQGLQLEILEGFEAWERFRRSSWTGQSR